jgi:hypothetical protein
MEKQDFDKPLLADAVAGFGGEGHSPERLTKMSVGSAGVTPPADSIDALKRALDKPDRKALAMIHGLAQTRAPHLALWNEVYLAVSRQLVSRFLGKGIKNLTDGELQRLHMLSSGAIERDRSIIAASASPGSQPTGAAQATVMVTLEYGGQRVDFGPDSRDRVRKAFLSLLPPDEDVKSIVEAGGSE